MLTLRGWAWAFCASVLLLNYVYLCGFMLGGAQRTRVCSGDQLLFLLRRIGSELLRRGYSGDELFVLLRRMESELLRCGYSGDELFVLLRRMERKLSRRGYNGYQEIKSSVARKASYRDAGTADTRKSNPPSRGK